MRITSNQIGNYGPGYARELQQPKQSLQLRQTGSVQRSETLQRPQEVRQMQPAVNEKISSDEKNFFASMYPESRREIDMHFYMKSGRMSGVSVGTLIDRRG